VLPDFGFVGISGDDAAAGDAYLSGKVVADAGIDIRADMVLEPVSKVPVINHLQRRTAFEFDTCRLVLMDWTPLMPQSGHWQFL
jgi:hypothetical protein